MTESLFPEQGFAVTAAFAAECWRSVATRSRGTAWSGPTEPDPIYGSAAPGGVNTEALRFTANFSDGQPNTAGEAGISGRTGTGTRRSKIFCSAPVRIRRRRSGQVNSSVVREMLCDERALCAIPDSAAFEKDGHREVARPDPNLHPGTPRYPDDSLSWTWLVRGKKWPPVMDSRVHSLTAGAVPGLGR